MQLAMVGLGRMGANIARRLLRGGHNVVAYDIDPGAVAALVRDGAASAPSLTELVPQLTPPRVVWVMLPAGKITEDAVAEIASLLSPGDTVIDGGNTHYKDDVRRAHALKQKSLHYVDVGTSGGVWGWERGYCMMIGGDKEVVDRLDPIFQALAPGVGAIAKTPHREGRDGRVENGYMHTGPAGSGHFVKMVHNGIEYGMMQAFAEGFEIMRARANPDLVANERFDLDLGDVAEVWRRGSVVSSWLLDLTAMALAESDSLENFTGFVQDSGEGRWTIEAAIEEAVPANVLSAALFARFASRQSNGFANRLLSAMRAKFGGHIEGTP